MAPVDPVVPAVGSDEDGPIRCPGCAREYAPALFEGGRTLHCTCGRRVRAAPLPGPEPADGRPLFFADAMLGRLARWLRVLGYDTAWRAHIPDGELVRIAAAEGRIVLTRDRRLATEWHYDGIRLVDAEAPAEQLAEVARAFDLIGRARLFGRCVRCNEPLVSIPPELARDEVPARIFAEQDDFRRCGACGRIYWRGSHTRRMRKALASILGEDVGHRQEGDPSDQGAEPGRKDPDGDGGDGNSSSTVRSAPP